MKKIIAILLVLILSLGIVACGSGKTEKTDAPAATEKATDAPEKEATDTPEEEVTEAEAAEETEAADAELEKIIIGATPNPHEEILKEVVEDLKGKGVELVIEVYTDYKTPNRALSEGSIDANYFQHIPYFEDENAANDYKLEILGGVHIEPMGIFSTKIESIDDLKDGDEVMIPNDPVNGGRALLILQAKGIIKLKDGGGLESTVGDIVENEKNLKFTELEAAAIPRSYQDATIALINGNYALENGLNPAEDAIALEDESSPYVNIIAVREGDAKLPKFKALLEVLQSDKIKGFIEEKYGGSVVPAFSKPGE
jgi:D-methionine transport system substrate-binding protein